MFLYKNLERGPVCDEERHFVDGMIVTSGGPPLPPGIDERFEDDSSRPHRFEYVSDQPLLLREVMGPKFPLCVNKLEEIGFDPLSSRVEVFGWKNTKSLTFYFILKDETVPLRYPTILIGANILSSEKQFPYKDGTIEILFRRNCSQGQESKLFLELDEEFGFGVVASRQKNVVIDDDFRGMMQLEQLCEEGVLRTEKV